MTLPDSIKSDESDEYVIIDEMADKDVDSRGLDAAANAYLSGLGVDAQGTADAFRLGLPDDATLARLGLVGRKRPMGGGVSIPTWLPEDPSRIVGLVRITTSQNIHRFASAPPAGIAGPTSLATAPRIVLCDNPVLALKLHQAGANDGNVALVENLAIIPPLLAWLAGREVVLVSYRSWQLEKLRAAFGERGPSLLGIVLATTGLLTQEQREAFGLPDKATPGPAAPMSERLIRDLHAFAVRGLATSEGQAALRAVGIEDRAVLDAYTMGYLSSDYGKALNDADRLTLSGLALARGLVCPAFDEQGTIVDLYATQIIETGHTTRSVWPEPRGMLAPRLATAYPRLVVTDGMRSLARLFRRDAPVLLLRGIADASLNARRLVTAGVSDVAMRCHRHGAAMAAILREAGIRIDGKEVDSDPASVLGTLQPPKVNDMTPPGLLEESSETPIEPALTLVVHDHQQERATFIYGRARFIVQVPWNGKTMLSVACTVGEREHSDPAIDLAVPAQRRRFAAACSVRTGLAASVIENALPLLCEAVMALGVEVVAPSIDQARSATSALTDDDRQAAMAVLRAPRLLHRLCDDLAGMGWHGEIDTMALVALAGISRLADQPLWLALTAGGAGERFPALRCIEAITPPEHVLHVSRLSDNALTGSVPNALRNKLLLVDDVAAISSAAATALRILHSRGAITGSLVQRDVLTGKMRTTFTASQGPIAVIAAAPDQVPLLLRHHLIDVSIDESPEMALRTLEARRQALANPQAMARVDQRAAYWRRAISLLVPATVIIPADAAVDLPPIVARNRPLQDACFALISASALLHQHQRLRLDGAVIATPDDIALGIRLATGLAAIRASDLSAQARTLLTRMWTTGRTTFVMADLVALLPSWTNWALRTALHELARADCLDPGRTGQGKLRTYTLLVTPTSYDTPNRQLCGFSDLRGDAPQSSTREASNA